MKDEKIIEYLQEKGYTFKDETSKKEGIKTIKADKSFAGATNDKDRKAAIDELIDKNELTLVKYNGKNVTTHTPGKSSEESETYDKNTDSEDSISIKEADTLRAYSLIKKIKLGVENLKINVSNDILGIFDDFENYVSALQLDTTASDIDDIVKVAIEELWPEYKNEANGYVDLDAIDDGTILKAIIDNPTKFGFIGDKDAEVSYQGDGKYKISFSGEYGRETKTFSIGDYGIDAVYEATGPGDPGKTNYAYYKTTYADTDGTEYGHIYLDQSGIRGNKSAYRVKGNQAVLSNCPPIEMYEADRSSVYVSGQYVDKNGCEQMYTNFEKV